jgi:hypothetical protein
MTSPLKGAKPLRSNQKREVLESPTEWSKLPQCGEPFSESHDGPLAGQTTYFHPNRERCIVSALGAATPMSATAAHFSKSARSGADAKVAGLFR